MDTEVVSINSEAKALNIEEKRNIILTDVGLNKVSVIKVVANICDVSIYDAKEGINKLCETGMSLVLPVVNEDYQEGDALKALVDIGAVAHIANTEDLEQETIGIISTRPKKIVSKSKTVSPDSVEAMDRTELLEVFAEIKKVTTSIDANYKSIMSVTDDIDKVQKKAEEIRNDVSLWVYVVDIIVFVAILIICAIAGIFFIGLVAACFVTPYLHKDIFICVDKMINSNKREEAAQEFLDEKLPPLEKNIFNIQSEINKIMLSEEYRWGVDIIGDDLMNTEAINELASYIKTRRADTLKEALNKYDSTQHINKMEEMQLAIQNASEMTAIEAAKQTAYAKETAKSSQQAASAAKATAYHTRQTARNTKNIDRNTRRFR